MEHFCRQKIYISLVSKTFASLISSYELYKTRCLQNTYEEILHVCLQFPMDRRPSWFSLWLKPNQTLTNDLERKEKSSRNALLVQIPSSYCPHRPKFMFMVGSEWYAINQCGYPASDLSVYKSGIWNWREAPNMTVARGEDVIAGVLNDKIYVMGAKMNQRIGLRFSIQILKHGNLYLTLVSSYAVLHLGKWGGGGGGGGKIYVISSKRIEYDVYDTKEGRWEVVVQSPMFEFSCVIENVRYYYGDKGFLWYDEKLKDWRTINGLGLGTAEVVLIEMADYSGKLLMIWDKYKQYKHHPEKKIWCALIAFEKRNNDDEVWGKVEWANIVRTVPNSSAAMNSVSEPSEIEEKNFNPSLSLFSLPEDIVLNCIALSKTFGSLVSSFELYKSRFLQKTNEHTLHVCLEFSNYSRRLSWYTLWLKPNQTLTNDLEKKEKSTGNALLVAKPSSYCQRLPTFMCMVGSELYAINNYENGNWLADVPKMTVARDNAIAGILDGKIYVVGGFSIYESKNWAEVYDTKTQTWESLPDPGVQLRSLYYNEKHNCWTRVNGLSVLERHCRGNIEMANYGGKLLMIWEKVVHTCHCYDEKNIWCALIAFEIRNGDEEVWGKVEWANSVLTVPISCNFTSHQQDGYHNYRKAYELLPPSTAKHSYTDGDVNLEKASWGRQSP
ncbi:LOW QUALITY PROTEIN: hypothetical protein HID58_053057 [Brassica napus]|uniref:FKB95-like N-terminal Kelch domain-containing protein n=1 Tax=Brassica napus TaxID=3708 RepID=A0ABQ8ADT1_BRANA|nr:LOW QUALITY PROTEIN: hypothetical protein HID58_053057 [Brassica napus]